MKIKSVQKSAAFNDKTSKIFCCLMLTFPFMKYIRHTIVVIKKRDTVHGAERVDHREREVVIISNKKQKATVKSSLPDNL